LFTVIDVETTGAVHKYGKITEIAIYVHDGQEITDSFVTLVNPEIDIPLYITRLTGITNEMVSEAPRFYEIARKIVEITTGRIFVAHNVNFDYQFIREEFLRLGYEFNRKKICTVRLSRRLLPGHSSYSLGKLCDDLGISIEGRHRASGDALATVRLFEKLLSKNQETGMIPKLNRTGNLF
jgi:DNA polymerase III subunit epsilon